MKSTPIGDADRANRAKACCTRSSKSVRLARPVRGSWSALRVRLVPLSGGAVEVIGEESAFQCKADLRSDGVKEFQLVATEEAHLRRGAVVDAQDAER